MTKFEMMTKVFPALKQKQEWEDLRDSEIKIEKFKPELLFVTGNTYSKNGSLGYADDGTKFYIILGKDLVLIPPDHIWDSDGVKGKVRGFNIAEYITKNKLPPEKIDAVVKYSWCDDNWIGDTVMDTRELTIYPIQNKEIVAEAIRKWQEKKKKEWEDELRRATS